MEEIYLNILKPLFTAGLGGVAILIYIVFFPDKVALLLSAIWKTLEKLGLFLKVANKEKIKYSIQGKLAGYSFDLADKLPEFNSPGIKVEWVDGDTTRKAFFENNVAVIRLRRDEPDHENLVIGTKIFVSDVLLKKSGRYLTQSQKNAVELFVGYKLLSNEKDEIVDSFVESWLYPGINDTNPKTSEYFNRYKNIDKANYFIPIYLQEILFLGEKVFGRRKNDSIYEEIDNSLSFLELYAARKLGEKIAKTYFAGETCKFSIMIVGKKYKVIQEGSEPYIQHIKEKLIPCGVETIYMIGPMDNKAFIDLIAEQVQNTFRKIYSYDYKGYILNQNGNKNPAWTNLTVLRKIVRDRFIDN